MVPPAAPPFPFLRMAEFLTVNRLRSSPANPSSIRRILYPIIENDAHKDRSVKPSVEERRNFDERCDVPVAAE